MNERLQKDLVEVERTIERLVSELGEAHRKKEDLELKIAESADARVNEVRAKLVDAGLTEEAIEAALATQFGKQPEPKKPRRKAEELELASHMTCTTWMTIKDLMAHSGAPRSAIIKQLNQFIEQGYAMKQGVRPAFYRLTSLGE